MCACVRASVFPSVRACLCVCVGGGGEHVRARACVRACVSV